MCSVNSCCACRRLRLQASALANGASMTPSSPVHVICVVYLDFDLTMSEGAGAKDGKLTATFYIGKGLDGQLVVMPMTESSGRVVRSAKRPHA